MKLSLSSGGIQEWGGQPDCENPSSCSPACNSLKFNWYAPGYEPEEFTSISEIENIRINSRISPNPNDGTFSVIFIDDILGEITLFIYDLKGDIVLNQKFNKNNKDFSSNIKLGSSLSNGKYYYQIKVNGKIESIGSFIISK